MPSVVIVGKNRTLDEATGYNKNAANSVIHDRTTAFLDVSDIVQEKIFVDLMRKHTKLYQIWRGFDLLTAMFALAGLILALVEYEIGFLNHHEERNVEQVERSIIRLSKLSIY